MPQPAVDANRARANRPRRVAVVTDQLPLPGLAGHLSLNFSFIRALESRGDELLVVLTEPRLPTIATCAKRHFDRTAIAGPEIRCFNGWCIAVSPKSLAKILAKNLIARLPAGTAAALRRVRRPGRHRFDVIMGRFTTGRQARHAADLLRRFHPDYLLIDTIFRTPVLDCAPSTTKTLVLMHDLFHQRRESLTARGFRVAPEDLDASTELALLRRFDVIIANNEREAALLNHLLPEKEVVVIAKPLHPVYPLHNERDPQRCIFVGSSAMHNVDGLQWFLEEVWPHVRNTSPSAELHVYGTVCGQMRGSVPGVTLCGAVPDLTEAYFRASIGICPLRAGSGLKIKMLDYITYGLPCVTSSIGAQGFPVNDDYPLIVADDPMSFAGRLSDLLNDKPRAAALSAKAYRYCRLFSEEETLATLQKYIA